MHVCVCDNSCGLAFACSMVSNTVRIFSSLPFTVISMSRLNSVGMRGALKIAIDVDPAYKSQ